MSTFFIGYNWPQPPETLRLVRRTALGLGLGVIGLSGALAAGHIVVDGGSFEFGRPRSVSGVIVSSPYPMLRPEDGAEPWPLLVGKGKHGAGDAVSALDGERVVLTATRIERGGRTMLELEESPVQNRRPRGPTLVTEPAGAGGGQPEAGQVATLRGEIVDSKCYLGVMVPGSGHTHRDCASLCLRGGIPPALAVRDMDGRTMLVLLVGSPAALRERAAALAGRTVTVSGIIGRSGGWTTLRSDPAGWTTGR